MLTPDALRAWRKQGYLVLRDHLDAERVAALRAVVEEIQAWPEAPGRWMHYFESSPAGDDGRQLCRTENFYPYHGGFAAFLDDPASQELVGELLDEPAVLFKEKINYKLPGGAGFVAHQDAPAYTTFAQTHHITLLVPVDAMTSDDGCLEVVSGRHGEGMLPQEADGTLARSWVESADWRTVGAAPGDVVVLDSYAPHRSGVNRTARPRRAFYLTFNAASHGDFREAYYADKRRRFPPECERGPDGAVGDGSGVYNLGNPIR